MGNNNNPQTHVLILTKDSTLLPLVEMCVVDVKGVDGSYPILSREGSWWDRGQYQHSRAF